MQAYDWISQLLQGFYTSRYRTYRQLRVILDTLEIPQALELPRNLGYIAVTCNQVRVHVRWRYIRF